MKKLLCFFFGHHWKTHSWVGNFDSDHYDLYQHCSWCLAPRKTIEYR